MNLSLGDLYASLDPDEVGVVLCCILPADDPMPRYPEWKRAAKTLGMGLSTIYRVRNALLSRGVLVDQGTHFTLDETQVVPRGPIARLAAAAMERGVLSPSVGKISYKGFPTSTPQSSNSENGQSGEVPPLEPKGVKRGNPPGPPNGKSPAGAPLCSALPGSNSQAEQSVTGDADWSEAWIAGDLERLEPFAVSIAAPLMGQDAARKFGAGVVKFATKVEPKALRRALILFAIRYPKDKIRKPLGWVETLANDWSAGEPDIEQYAAIERWEREYAAQHAPKMTEGTIVFPERKPFAGERRPARQVASAMKIFTDPESNRARASTA